MSFFFASTYSTIYVASSKVLKLLNLFLRSSHNQHISLKLAVYIGFVFAGV